MSLIEFDYSTKLIYIIFYFIFIQISSFIYMKLYIIDENNIKEIKAFNISLILSLLQLFGILLFKITLKNIKNEEEKLNQENKNNITIPSNEVTIIQSEIDYKKIIKIMIYLLLCSIFECMRYIFSILQKEYKDVGYYISGLYMAELMILSFFILNYNIYEHNILSLILIFISDILLEILEKNDYLYFILNYMETQYNHLIDFLFIPLKICLEKYLMLKFFLNPYLILFIEGIYQSFIYIIYFIIRYYFDRSLFEKEIIFLKDFLQHYIYYILYLFCFIGVKILELLINDTFEPSYIILASCSFVFVSPIKIIFKNEDSFSKIIFYLITYLIYFLAIIIYSEVIILNFWNLEKNTKKKIKLRSIIEVKDIENNYEIIE